MSFFNDGRADFLDAQADLAMAEQREYEEYLIEMEEEFCYRQLEARKDKQELAIKYGIPVDEITGGLKQSVKFLKRYGSETRTIPLAEGRLTVRQEIVDCDGLGDYYLKTGWYTRDGVSCFTPTTDDFAMTLVSQEMKDGKVI